MECKPLTHKIKDQNIAGLRCQCNSCGFIHTCSFGTDFYTLSFVEYAEDEPRPLYCESCMWSEAKKVKKIN